MLQARQSAVYFFTFGRVTSEQLIAFLLAYLIGSIPTSVWFGKIFYGKDVRDFGSGNAGATNTFRVFGAIPGIIVLLIDIGKGVVAVLLASIFNGADFSSSQFLYYQMALGLTAAIAHIFPVYLGFKGGKGVATFFGVILIVFPIAALVCTIAFLITFFVSRYVSLSSVIASVAFTVSVFLWYLESVKQIPLILFAIAVPLIIIYTHRKNIQRLMNGTESKMNFSKKESQS